MIDGAGIADISQGIQLSLAPVFLLVGIAGFINVFVARLSRVVDRSRVVEASLRHADLPTRTKALRELGLLDQRAQMVYLGIKLGIFTALLVSIVIVMVFIEVLLNTSHPLLIGALFVVAMLSLIGALLAFLREVFLALRSVTLSRSRETVLDPEH